MVRRAYFDYAATTPADERVVSAMEPYWGFCGHYGNAASIQHEYGIAAAEAVENSRRHLARLIIASPTEIIWTSGATESINLALRGSVSAAKKPMRLVSVTTEHDAVRSTVTSLRGSGVETTILPVGKGGLINLSRLEEAIRGGNVLVSVMWVNNETGIIQPIGDISEMCKKAGAVLHVDAAQALARLEVNLKKLPIDLMSISSHKAYGPKGIGALFVRKGTKLSPLLTGGGQERNLRSGTLPVPLIVGAGKAFEILKTAMRKQAIDAATFNEQICGIVSRLGGKINGDAKSKVLHILSVRFPGTSGNLLPLLTRVATANGSACSTSKVSASHVLTSMGLSKIEAISSIRISTGRYTTRDDITFLEEDLESVVARLRRLD